MATAFLLWSSPNPTVHQDPVIDSGEILPSSTTGSSPAPAKPKARKQGGGAASSAKRPPQRGLGVAQLERLRLQEHLEKFSAGDHGGRQLLPQQHPRQIRPLPPMQLPPPQTAFYDSQQYARSPVALGFSVPRYGVPVGVPGSGCYLDPSPNAAAPLPGMDPNWYIHRCISPAKVVSGYGGPHIPPEDVRSMLQGQYKMDRFRTNVDVASGDSRFLRSLGVPVQEPPSTQIRQCRYANCEFCERKKCLFGDDPIQNIMHAAGDYFDGNADASGTAHRALEGSGSYDRKGNSMKEFEFFPASSNSTTSASEGLAGHASSGASDSMAAASASGDAFCTSSTSSHSSISLAAAAAPAPTCLDLSLKL